MRLFRLLPLMCSFVLLGTVSAQTLTNDSVLKMVKAGLGEEVVLSMVQGQTGQYTVTPEELIRLKQAGVSDKILAAMAAKGSAPAGAAAPAATAAATGDIPQGLDIGVYYKKGSAWEEMLPEVVNWKSGGVIKHIASAGVVKGDVNGNLRGPHSRNSLKSPIEVLICAREGVAITEYQLIRLRTNEDYREFRTVTGGVFHESGGSNRDLVPFEGKKIANRMYTVILPNLGAGEYGFLPPEAVSLSKGASIGKMHTFRLLE